MRRTGRPMSGTNLAYCATSCYGRRGTIESKRIKTCRQNGTSSFFFSFSWKFSRFPSSLSLHITHTTHTEHRTPHTQHTQTRNTFSLLQKKRPSNQPTRRLQHTSLTRRGRAQRERLARREQEELEQRCGALEDIVERCLLLSSSSFFSFLFSQFLHVLDGVHDPSTQARLARFTVQRDAFFNFVFAFFFLLARGGCGCVCFFLFARGGLCAQVRARAARQGGGARRAPRRAGPGRRQTHRQGVTLHTKPPYVLTCADSRRVLTSCFFQVCLTGGRR